MNRMTMRVLLTGSALLLMGRAFTYFDGPPAAHTGAPGERTCNTSGCHTGRALNATGGSITITGLPAEYVPGAKYTVGVQVAKSGQSRWGFQLTAKKADGSRGGEINVTQPDFTMLINANRPTATSPRYLEHTTQGTFEGVDDASPGWNFEWVAPAEGTGPVTFYAAGNAANGDDDNSGDFIYTTSATVPEAAPTPTVMYGDLNGDNRVNVQDATLALRIAVGLVQPTEQQTLAGDVAPSPGTGPRAGEPFGDGRINVGDATRILRRAVGIDPTFPQ